MSLHIHALARWRIERLFTGKLTSRDRRALLRDLRGCPACTALYARYGDLQASLCGDPNVLALERIEAALEDQLGNEGTRPARWRRPALVLAASAACLLALVIPVRSPSDHVPLAPEAKLVGIVARGQHVPRSANVGIRMFRALPQGVSEPQLLSIDDVVTFTWTDLDPAARYVSIFGVQEDGRIRWYYQGTKLEGFGSDEPFGEGIRLGVRHQPGWLRVTALFSAGPLDPSKVEQAVRAQKGPLEALDPLLLEEGVLEHSIRVEIAAKAVTRRQP
ncbi:MAG TPA: hypothetical protein VGK67_33365 [Myxococcales bacterium]|jgi:hypothetical protein